MHFAQIISVLAVLSTTIAAPSPKRNHIQVQARATVEARQPFNPYHSAHRFAATAANKKRASNHGRDAAPVEKRRAKKRGKTCGVKSAAAKVVVPTSVSSTVATPSVSATDYYVPSATESAWADTSSVVSSSVDYASASATLNVQNAAVHTSSSVVPTTTPASSTAWSSSAAASSSAAPATTSADSSDGDWKTGGHATWYQQNGNAGACGEYNSDDAPIIAINGVSSSSYWADYSQKSPYCGRWVDIVNTDNGKTVSAKIADVCPTCPGNGESIDLSIGAFQALGTLDQGMLNIKWRFQ
ncbi:hypothetical protein QFC20_004295 [Naganishia adeliensis]|uniref:Uncharacterized protein n=1 Tax=Naganishia adeliensis TaxID=92952 RepID=A0ACC2W3C7_9TREE|nr:hypothetical protein QFC20_004295 [Naganishia adeliensis]